MQAVMETVFEIPYLIGVITLGAFILHNANHHRLFILYGIMAIILGCGDAFHLIPRMYALWTDGIANHAASLGFGKLVTSITMTIFYLFLYHIWQVRYKKKNTMLQTLILYLLAAARFILCFFPQNQWFSASAPVSWGVYRNLPFLLMGLCIIYLYYCEARKSKDRVFQFMWLAILLSFTFYIPVVLWADSIPILGMLMLPKTCAYVWIVWMGYTGSKQRSKQRGM